MLIRYFIVFEVFLTIIVSLVILAQAISISFHYHVSDQSKLIANFCNLLRSFFSFGQIAVSVRLHFEEFLIDKRHKAIWARDCINHTHKLCTKHEMISTQKYNILFQIKNHRPIIIVS